MHGADVMARFTISSQNTSKISAAAERPLKPFAGGLSPLPRSMAQERLPDPRGDSQGEKCLQRATRYRRPKSHRCSENVVNAGGVLRISANRSGFMLTEGEEREWDSPAFSRDIRVPERRSIDVRKSSRRPESASSFLSQFVIVCRVTLN